MSVVLGDTHPTLSIFGSLQNRKALNWRSIEDDGSPRLTYTFSKHFYVDFRLEGPTVQGVTSAWRGLEELPLFM